MYEYITNIKTNTKCKDCKKSWPSYCMEFDHVRGKKKFNIGEAVTLQVTMQELKTELAKTEVRCKNCHAIQTHNRRKALQIKFNGRKR